MATTQPPATGGGHDDELELEPTLTLSTVEPPSNWSDDDSVASSTPEASPHAAGVAVLAGAGVSLGGETSDLRRERLAAISAFLAVAYGLLLIFNVLQGAMTAPLILALMTIRVIIPAVAAVVLYSRQVLERGHVRAIEYGVFGALGLLIVATQYFIPLQLLSDGRVPSAVAFWKNGMVQTFTLMILYGTFLPNTAKSAAQVVLTLALAPILGQILLVENHPELGESIRLAHTAEPFGTNLVYLLIGAGASIYAAKILGNLRADLHEARRFGQYHLIRKLGEGGMGEVYLAEHQLLKRPCALKLIKADSTGDGVALARFEREVRSAARLSHPNSIGIFDYGRTNDGTFYYVMEYLVGLSLGDLVTHFGALPPGRAVYLLRQACAGLAEAHALGIVHRDLKPANIFVAIQGGEYDVVKVLDFGLVKLTAEPNAVALTRDQTVSGTPLYMAPEQASGASDLDSRADIYALGAIAYYTLTGQPPFQGESPFAVMMSHVRDTPAPPSKHRPGIPADLEAVVMRCLNKAPGERYQTVKALSEALASCACAGQWGENRAETWWKTTAEVLTAESDATVAAEPSDPGLVLEG